MIVVSDRNILTLILGFDLLITIGQRPILNQTDVEHVCETLF